MRHYHWESTSSARYMADVLREAGRTVRYYGVSYNIVYVRNFLRTAIQILFKWLNLRSQRKSFDWGKFTQFMKLYPSPKARVCHRLF